MLSLLNMLGTFILVRGFSSKVGIEEARWQFFIARRRYCYVYIKCNRERGDCSI